MSYSAELSPGEGAFIKRPNGTEALRLISYEAATVVTERDEATGMIKVIISFKEPFIHPTDKRPRATRKKDE